MVEVDDVSDGCTMALREAMASNEASMERSTFVASVVKGFSPAMAFLFDLGTGVDDEGLCSDCEEEVVAPRPRP